MANTQNDSTMQPNVIRHYGVVKWFDKMKGYGFLQQLNTTNDYFVHYTQLQSEDESDTKYLVAGEYVEFSITASVMSKPQNNAANEQHGETTHPAEIAANVTGIMGGPLLYRSQQQQRAFHRSSFNRSSRRPYRQHNKSQSTLHKPAPSEQVGQTNRFDVLENE